VAAFGVPAADVDGVARGDEPTGGLEAESLVRPGDQCCRHASRLGFRACSKSSRGRYPSARSLRPQDLFQRRPALGGVVVDGAFDRFFEALGRHRTYQLPVTGFAPARLLRHGGRPPGHPVGKPAVGEPAGKRLLGQAALVPRRDILIGEPRTGASSARHRPAASSPPGRKPPFPPAFTKAGAAGAQRVFTSD